MDYFSSEANSVPVPVLFNPFKHHRNFIMQVLNRMDFDTTACLLEAVCNNYIDIYTGDLSPKDIGLSVIEKIGRNKVLNKDEFTGWVKNAYRQIQLDDQSEWIVRKSEDLERYVHIHPARKSAFTVRFKGAGLKTIYLLKTRIGQQNGSPSLEEVNRIRIRIALSPIKRLEQGKGILRCYEIFFDG